MRTWTEIEAFLDVDGFKTASSQSTLKQLQDRFQLSPGELRLVLNRLDPTRISSTRKSGYDEVDLDHFKYLLRTKGVVAAQEYSGFKTWQYKEFCQTHGVTLTSVIEDFLESIDLPTLKAFYLTHTLKETREQFGLKQSHLAKILKDQGWSKNRDLVENREMAEARIDISDLASFYASNSIEQTLGKFDLTPYEFDRIADKHGIRKFDKRPKEVRFEGVPVEEIGKSYESLSRKELFAAFPHIEPKDILFILKAFGYQRANPGFNGDPATTANRLRSLREDFWADSDRTRASYLKSLKTMEERYGDPNYNQRRATESMVEKYGTSLISQIPGVMDKVRKTLLERYGVSNPGLIHAESKQSAQELSLLPTLERLGLRSNDLTGLIHKRPFGVRFSNGKGKYPDFIDYESKIALEYNGSYWHQDLDEPQEWLAQWSELGWKISIVWDFEREEFIKSPPGTTEELLKRYPCTFRRPASATR